MQRSAIRSEIAAALKRRRIVVLTGPRQCGKTTLARSFVPERSLNYFDLENPVSVRRLTEPMTQLEALTGLVVIDEVQRLPALFPVLRVLADRKTSRTRFLILGSISPDLMRNVSESLAGRTETLELTPFSTAEAPRSAVEKLWLRGGFPLSFLARSEKDSYRWRRDYIDTFLRLDMPFLGINLATETMRRFWQMLAHYHANIWNAAEPARSLGISETTVRRYLDILTGLYMIRQLKPWHENLGKRQVKAPKIYFRDTGILHSMLGVETRAELHTHMKVGASWEGFVVEEILRRNPDADAYFWATHAGAELDLLLVRGGRRIGYEIKRADAPALTASMRVAFSDLKLERLHVVYPGNTQYRLAPGVQTLPAAQLF